MLDVLFGIPNWALALITIALIAFAVFWHYTQLQRLGYKCSTPWPILGHWHLILSKGYRSDTDNKDKYGKVFAQYEGWRPSVVVCDPKLIKECTVTKFSDYPQRIVPFPVSKEVEYAVTTALGSEWKRQRNIMTRAFSAAKMRKLTILINNCARQFCGSLQEKVERNENIEVRKTCGEFVMRVVATSLFGIDVSKDEELGKFARYAVKMSASLDLKNPVMFLSLLSRKITPIFKAMGYGYKRRGPVAMECFNFFKRTMIILKKSREDLDENAKPNDLLQLLLDGHKADTILKKASVLTSAFDETEESVAVTADAVDSSKRGFSTEEIVSNAIIFFSAGYITTTAALGWMMYLLATHEDIQEKLLREVEEYWPQDPDTVDLSYDTIARMTYLDQVFCETLRVFPSTQRMDRVSVRDSSIGGRPIPKGIQVNISIWSVHHDEDYWPDPFKFDPERFAPENKDKIEPYSYIPFGSGPRNCIGMRLATLEAKVAISHLVKRYRLLPCADTEIPPNLRNQVHTAPTAGIVLKLDPRK